ncbi:hypothetical protein [Trichlorobacter ammonificans]|uniref:Zinc ribbon domain-containing protein n=1 Tax=Trichlorobacter ammonificans TaxID=2916410 RepID=A0ABM9D5L9_9BACT|nr:hypothetical protein [Trichlorobacter ammonificans]CAH2030545.1 conserved protein of unknown function [Trichlorobacter ammonificans]
MKCPACGFNSFESNDSCPKCAAGLKEVKQTYGLTAVVLSPAHRRALTAEYATASVAVDTGAQMFSFELPGAEPEQTPPQAAGADPFSFIDSPTPETVAPPAAAPDPFAELLESTTRSEPQPSAATAPAPTVSDQGYELSSFSWDDTPPAEPACPEAEAPAAPEDDFASLFGDLGEPKK